VLDAEDWARLYDEAFPEVYRALTATLLDPQLALDALQDAFLEGLTHPPHHTENLRGWLYVVGIRKGRRLSRRVRGFLSLDWLRERGLKGRSADDTIERLLDQIAVQDLLALLTERQRTVIIAYYYLGMSQEEIAASMRLRRGTIASTVSRALDKMRKGGVYVG
jgi:RNA polymerase sigma factor (sigma-70 family)